MELTTQTSVTDVQAQITNLELAMLEQPELLVELPLIHRFVPGMYVREIFMPAGTLLTSKLHKTQHMYTVIEGRVSVFIEGGGVEHITAPHVGITMPGTRRVLYVHEDCRWLTYHPTPDGETDLDILEERLIEPILLPEGDTTHQRYIRGLEAQTLSLDSLPVQEDYVGAP